MIAHTQQFKEELNTFGRQYKNKISIYDDLKLGTENNDTIITQDNLELIARISDNDFIQEIEDEHLYNIHIITKGELLSTLMKEIDFESDIDFEIGKVFNYQFGIKIENTYEYLDYGKYIIYKKEYKSDTETYIYTCYDYMLKTMIPIGNEFRFAENPTGADMLPKICNILGLEFDNSLIENSKPTAYGMIKNLTYNVNIDTIIESKITYRDLLNSLCQYFGVSMYVSNNELKIKLLGDIVNDNGWKVDNENPIIVDTLEEKIFKDKNVSFNQKYGKINALNISGTDETKTAYVEDRDSYNQNGLTLFEVKNNIILNDDNIWENYSNDIANNIFELINGVSFNLCDFSTFGVMYLEWLDYFNVSINNENYTCLLLNSEITIKSGIGENIYTDLPEKNVSEYTTTPKSNDIIADTIRARGNAYANGYKLVQENEKNIYSTKETEIGKWIDGIPIYQKMIYIDSFPNATSKDYEHGIDNLKNVIKVYGYAYNQNVNNGETLPIPFTYNNLGSNISIYVAGAYVRINTSSNDRSAYSGYIILEYTKF